VAGKHDGGPSKHNGVIAGPTLPRLRLGVLFAGRVDSHQPSAMMIGEPSFGLS